MICLKRLDLHVRQSHPDGSNAVRMKLSLGPDHVHLSLQYEGMRCALRIYSNQIVLIDNSVDQSDYLSIYFIRSFTVG